MKRAARICLILIACFAALGCAPTGKRAIVMESTAPDGIWALGGWLIRQYDEIEMRTAYDAVAKVARERNWEPEDRDYRRFESELEYEDSDGTEIEVRIWAPAEGPLEVGVQFDRGDGRAISADFLNRFEQITGAKRVK